jgi:NADPH:quinone reductase-like Zn-dependent oxidoreductase
MTQYGVFNENGLSMIPDSLSWEEGATLTCAGVTAWNALFGLKRVMPGDFVLTQGTGGVSLFAVQVCNPLLCTINFNRLVETV